MIVGLERTGVNEKGGIGGLSKKVHQYILRTLAGMQLDSY